MLRVFGRHLVRAATVRQRARVLPQAVALAPFYESFYSDEVFTSTCGVTPEVFDYVYRKYCGPAAQSRALRTVNQLYDALHYLKGYPEQRSMGIRMKGNLGMAHGPLYTRTHATVSALASVLDELNINEHDQLPAPWFANVGGSVDGFAVYCRTPKKDHVAKAFISGKYNAACVKFDLICNHAGVPLWFGGPYLVCHTLSCVGNVLNVRWTFRGFVTTIGCGQSTEIRCPRGFCFSAMRVMSEQKELCMRSNARAAAN
jgi:hypothetical protein